jgi:branched-chain amino acid transport system ATP-binding protein
MREALLAVDGLRLGYGRSDVIHGISFRVPRGAIVSLIGANGAGKSTTLRGISGLLKLRSGSIKFAGQEIAGEAPHKIAQRRLVQVPEGRQVFAEMTVAENLTMGAYLVADRRRRSGAPMPLLPAFRSSASVRHSVPDTCPAVSSRCWRSAAP